VRALKHSEEKSPFSQKIRKEGSSSPENEEGGERTVYKIPGRGAKEKKEKKDSGEKTTKGN